MQLTKIETLIKELEVNLAHHSDTTLKALLKIDERQIGYQAGVLDTLARTLSRAKEINSRNQFLSQKESDASEA